MSNLVKNGAENQAWRDKSNDLAQWAIAHLYARTDAFPEWNGQQWFCKKEAVTADHLAYHFRGSWTVGTYTIKPTEETCVYTAWDIDCHDLAADPDENWKTAETLYHRLFALGLRPILEDSNGDGGYHVWVIWDQPVSAALALSFGRWIVQDATVEVEVFPKQPQVGNGYGNQLRVPGHHHRRNHWSRFWDGGFRWLENEDAVHLLLTHRPASPERIPHRARSYTLPMVVAPQRPGQGSDMDAGDQWWKQYNGNLRTLDILEMCGDRLTGKVSSGWHEIVCPWADAHTDGKEVAYVREAEGEKFPVFRCHHQHCEEKRLGDLLALYEPARVGEHCTEHFGCNGHELNAAVEAVVQPASTTVDRRQEAPMVLRSVDQTMIMAPKADIKDIIEAEKARGAQLEKTPDQPAKPAAKPRKDGRRAYKASEFASLPKLDWLIEKHFQVGGYACIYGMPGSCKSFIALDQALSIVHGLPYLGKWKTKQAPVVYVCAEGQEGIRHRIDAWCIQNCKPVPDDLIVVPYTFALLRAEEVQAMAEIIGDALGDRKPGAIYFDTLARMFGGGDENSTKDMNTYVEHTASLGRIFQSAVCSVHHTGKDLGKGARGSIALEGACDTMLQISGTVEAGSIKVKCYKQKNAAQLPTYSLTPQAVSLPDCEQGSLVLFPEHWVKSKLKDLTEPQQVLYGALTGCVQPFTYTQGFNAYKGVGKPNEAGKSSYSDRLAALVNYRLVTKYKDGSYEVVRARSE